MSFLSSQRLGGNSVIANTSNINWCFLFLVQSRATFIWITHPAYKVGSLMVNVLVGFLEQQLFNKVPKPYCYVHFVDDTFAGFSSRNEELKFMAPLRNSAVIVDYPSCPSHSNSFWRTGLWSKGYNLLNTLNPIVGQSSLSRQLKEWQHRKPRIFG